MIFDSHIIKSSLARNVEYCVVGFVCMQLTNTYFSTVGITTAAYLKKRQNERSGVVTYIRSVLALLSHILFWVGTYNLFDKYAFTPSHCIDVIYMMGGVLLQAFTETLFVNAVSERDREGFAVVEQLDGLAPPVRAGMSRVRECMTALSFYALLHFRASCGQVGAILLWVGWSRLLEGDDGERTKSTLFQVIYVGCGFLILPLTNSLLHHGAVDDAVTPTHESIPMAEEQQDFTETTNPVVTQSQTILYFKAVISLCAYLMFWTGIDSMLYRVDTLLSASLYLSLGLLGMVITATLHAQAGIFMFTPGSVALHTMTRAPLAPQCARV